jgi:tRNA 2-thiouridine synthesizing protein A
LATNERRSMEHDLELDTRGLMCPLPLLRLKKALVSMNRGQLIRVQATDPASVLDFGVFLEQCGHLLVERWEESGTYLFLIRKG